MNSCIRIDGVAVANEAEVVWVAVRAIVSKSEIGFVLSCKSVDCHPSSHTKHFKYKYDVLRVSFLLPSKNRLKDGGKKEEPTGLWCPLWLSNVVSLGLFSQLQFRRKTIMQQRSCGTHFHSNGSDD